MRKHARDRIGPGPWYNVNLQLIANNLAESSFSDMSLADYGVVIDPESLDFEMNVDGLVSSGGLGGPAILPQSLAKMSQLTKAFPDGEFSGIGGISTFAHALNYMLLGCGTVQVCTAAMLDRAIGPTVIKNLIDGMQQFMEKRGYQSVEDFRGIRRDRVVLQSAIRRPDASDYEGGYEHAEGYAAPERAEAHAS